MTATQAHAAAPSGLRRWATQGPPRTAAERRALVDALEQSAGWPDAAVPLLANLGFRLIQPERIGGDANHLLIALRDGPTLRHFDPEEVDYYAPRQEGAVLVSLTRSTAPHVGDRVERHALWGQVHVLDRIPVENRFLTFGGDLRIATIDPTLTVIDLCAPGPIVRWGGHSQGTDPLAEAIGAFFGRLIVRVDFVPGAERRIDATPPEVLYRAFLADHRWRARQAELRGAFATELDASIAAAWSRAADEDPAASQAADELLEELDLIPSKP